MTRSERRVTLAATLTSVTQGRHFARDVLIEWGLPSLVADAQLGTSELVTNAVRHARTDVVLVVRRESAAAMAAIGPAGVVHGSGDVVTIEVHDGQPELPPLPSGEIVATTAESGRGLQIVAAISGDWGITSTRAGKSVWFTLRVPAEQDADDDNVFAMDRHRADRAERAERAERDAAARDGRRAMEEQARAGS